MEHTCSAERNTGEESDMCKSFQYVSTLIHTAAFKNDPTVWLNNLSHLSFSCLQDLQEYPDL